MGNVVPVDEFTGEWYPGYRPEHFDFPYWVDAPKPFQPGDEDAFWFLDFHWSRGLTPLAATLWSADGYCWGTQSASEKLPLPPGRGITCRFAGTHLYGSPIPEPDPREIGARANRLGVNLPHFLQNYRSIWEAGRDELEATWDYFQGVDFASVPTSDLAGLIQQGRRYHKRAMEIHFDVMYPMLVNFLGFYGACAELGIDTNLVGKFLQGEDTKIMELDRELYGLAVKARQAGLAQVFADNEPGDAARRALGARRLGVAVAHRLRRLPRRLRPPPGRDLRRRAAELDRGQHQRVRQHQDLPAEGRRPRFRCRPAQRPRGAGRGHRDRSLRSHQGGAGRVRRRPRRQPGRQLPVVAGRPQLLHRPEGHAAPPARLPGARAARGRRPQGRHALPVLAGAARRRRRASPTRAS